MKTKKTLNQLAAKKIINPQVIKGGHHFEDDEEFVAQYNAIKGR